MQHFILAAELILQLSTSLNDKRTIKRRHRIYLHIAFGGVRSIQQRFISSPFNWKTALKINDEFCETIQYDDK